MSWKRHPDNLYQGFPLLYPHTLNGGEEACLEAKRRCSGVADAADRSIYASRGGNDVSVPGVISKTEDGMIIGGAVGALASYYFFAEDMGGAGRLIVTFIGIGAGVYLGALLGAMTGINQQEYSLVTNKPVYTDEAIAFPEA